MESYFPLAVWQLTWYILILISGVLGNGIVIFVITKSKSIKRNSPFNVYLLALAIIDMAISIICVPIYVLSTSAFTHPTGVYGEVLCKILTSYAVPFWLLDASVLLLVAIAVERRKAILDPFSTLQEHPLKITLSYIGIAVLLSILAQTPTFYGSHLAKYNATVGNSCKFDGRSTVMDVLHYASFLWECLIPMIIFFVCLRHIRKHLTDVEIKLKSSLQGYYQGKTKHTIRSIKYRQETIETFKLVVIIFFVCVVLNEVTYILLGPVLRITMLEWNSTEYQITVMLRFSNSCVNPIIYGFRSKSFRKKVSDVFGDTYIGRMLIKRKVRNEDNCYARLSEVI